MKYFWANNEQADENGDFIAIVDMELTDAAGNKQNPQRFIGKSHKEVADKLLEAQMNATNKIIQMSTRTPAQPVPVTEETKPGPLTADERFAVANEVTEPEKSPEAITRAMEAAVGATAEDIRLTVEERKQRERNAAAGACAKKFIETTPDYFIHPDNSKAVMNYLKANRLDPTKQENYTYAWDNLKSMNLVYVKESDESGEVEQTEETTDAPAVEAVERVAAPAPVADEAGEFPAKPVTTVRPRVIASTGTRRVNSTATPGGPRPRDQYTLAQIDAMPTDEYLQKLKSEAGFAELVDKLKAQGQPAAAAR